MVRTVLKVVKDEPGILGKALLEAVVRIDGAVGSGGYKVVRRYLGDTSILKLTRAGVAMTEMAHFLSRLESTGVTREYPQLMSFLQEMVTEGGEVVMRDEDGMLTLGGRVTFALKRAALAKGEIPKDVLANLKGALGEAELLKRTPTQAGARSLIPPNGGVRHVNGHGPDRLISGPNTIEVGEAKARSSLRTKDLQNYIQKGTDGYRFNAKYLEQWIQNNGGGLALERELDSGKRVRFTLFTYAEKTDIPSELREVLLSGRPLPFEYRGQQYFADVTWIHMTPKP